MTILLTMALSLIAVFGSVFAHYDVLRMLARFARQAKRTDRRALAWAISALIGAHLAEIALFAVAFYFAVNDLGLGSFANNRSMAPMDYFYYAAETYSSLGYGDIYPLGAVRLLASVTPLVGILLLGWSAAFLSSLLDGDGDRRP